jgi:hypothetical protein
METFDQHTGYASQGTNVLGIANAMDHLNKLGGGKNDLTCYAANRLLL